MAVAFGPIPNSLKNNIISKTVTIKVHVKAPCTQVPAKIRLQNY